MKSKIFFIGFLIVIILIVLSGCNLFPKKVLSLCNDANKIAIQLAPNSSSGDTSASNHKLIAKFSITPQDCQLSISNFRLFTISQGVYTTNMQIYPEEFDENTTYSSVTSYSYDANSMSNGCFEKEQVDLSNEGKENSLIIEPNTTKNIVIRGDIVTVKVKNLSQEATQKIQLEKINDMEFTQPVTSGALIYKTNVGTPPSNSDCPVVDPLGPNPNF